MKYNEIIGRTIGQDRIKQEILYEMRQQKYAVFEIIGSAGSGKKTTSEIIARDFVMQYNGNVFYLNPVYQEITEDYSIFKALLYQTGHNKKVLLDIFRNSLKDVPCIGNSLSTITSELVSSLSSKRDFSKDGPEIEEYIISELQKFHKGADILYICNSFELWDLKSQQLLSHLIMFSKNDSHAKKVYFVINTCTQSLGLKGSDIKYKYLKKIGNDSLSEVINQFRPEIHLNSGQIDQIAELTDGNLELIKESANLFSTHIVSVDKSFYDIIEARIMKVVPNKAEDLLLLLKELAFIGEKTDKRFLSLFSSAEEEKYEELLGESLNLSFLFENDHLISFAQKYVYLVLQDILCKDRKYYLRMTKCINILYPSRYDLQLLYLYRGNLTYEAEKIFFIFLISYYRENNKVYELNEERKKQLEKNKLFPLYLSICEAYKLYKQKRYLEAENILESLYANELSLRFEIDYLLSLITTNMYNTMEEFSEKIHRLKVYVDDDFKRMFPEMYMRALMLLLEFYAEAGYEEPLREGLKEIMKCFAQYSSTDKQIQCYEHCFMMKANAFYKIEIACKQTQIALNYFKNNNNRQRYISKYYLSLLNHAANEIVLGKFEKSHNLLVEAHNIAKQYTHIKTLQEDILLNNLTISGFYSQKYDATECAKSLGRLIDTMQEQADLILLKSNQAVFMALSGAYANALSALESIYNNIQFNEDMDDYYRYYILNNYGILLWIMGQKEKSLQILDHAFALNPLPRDHSYFKARAIAICTLIKEKSANDILQAKNWNQYVYIQNPKTIGSAWKFWSALLLLSELQIWSDY